MASSSPTSFIFSPSSSSAAPTHHRLSRSHFKPIQECEGEELEEDFDAENRTAASDWGTISKHHPTPLNRADDRSNNGKSQTVRKRTESESNSVSSSDGVSCNRCRPHAREKISVVPIDNNNGVNKQTYFSMASPNGIFKSLISSLTRKSPKSINESSTLTAREEQWRAAVTELSQKLVQTTRKRDEAIIEASRLKYAMAELERKLYKLEAYCHGSKSGLQECSAGNSPCQIGKYHKIQSFHQTNQKQVIEHFLASVSESRSSIRFLSRSLTPQLRHVGAKVYEKISVLLEPYNVKISFSKNPRCLLFYLEALLNRAFFEDFESIGFQKNASTPVLNPIERCEANFGCFNFLHELTWEEVLNKGTKHFSEDFSRFCDRKMSEIVAMLGWNRVWPEPLLQAFFSASKSVWLLHLLANSVHPNLPMFRVEKEAVFDSVYMEDMSGDKARKLIPSVVRIMVAPGFYVYGSVVKCKVLCRYNAAITAADL